MAESARIYVGIRKGSLYVLQRGMPLDKKKSFSSPSDCSFEV